MQKPLQRKGLVTTGRHPKSLLESTNHDVVQFYNPDPICLIEVFLSRPVSLKLMSKTTTKINLKSQKLSQNCQDIEEYGGMKDFLTG